MKISIHSTVVIALAIAAISHEVGSILPKNDLSKLDQKILDAFYLKNKKATTNQEVNTLLVDLGPGNLDFVTQRQVNGFSLNLQTEDARCVAKDIWRQLKYYGSHRVCKTIDEVIEIAAGYANKSAAPTLGVSNFISHAAAYGYLTPQRASHLEQALDNGFDTPQEIADDALVTLRDYKETIVTHSIDQRIEQARKCFDDLGVTKGEVQALANGAKDDGYLDSAAVQKVANDLASNMDPPYQIAGDIKMALENYKQNLTPCP